MENFTSYSDSFKQTPESYKTFSGCHSEDKKRKQILIRKKNQRNVKNIGISKSWKKNKKITWDEKY